MAAGAVRMLDHGPGLVLLVYDGGCPFCRHFALRSELVGGVPGLTIRDGRADTALRHQLKRQGFDLARGAVLIDGDRPLHGAEAIAALCRQLQPSDPLLRLLAQLFEDPPRADRLYPLLLLARRLALWSRGLAEDPDHSPSK
jgi:predicted DCC family thiol-disulfide oxidoreductase YuxK